MVIGVCTTASLTAAPRSVAAASEGLVEAEAEPDAAVPALALAAAGGLAGAFVLGMAHGYLEGKNAQKQGDIRPASLGMNLREGDFEHVLD